MIECSFDDGQEPLALKTGHLTPKLLTKELVKLLPRVEQSALLLRSQAEVLMALGRRLPFPILVYHIKPNYRPAVERELLELRRGGVRIEIAVQGEDYAF